MAYTANKRRAIQGGILPVADGSYDALDRAIINGLPALDITPTTPVPHLPTLQKTEPKVLGTWKIDRVQAGTPQATFNLKEIKGAVKTLLPKFAFDQDTYPNAFPDVWGQTIPNCIGAVRAAPAFLIDQSTNTFKLVGHGLDGISSFYTEEFESFTPDVIDLVNGEFTYAAWNGSDSLYADIFTDEENAPDVVKVLLTDSVRGANLPLTALDTTSTGKGFGANGARIKYIRGTEFRTGKEKVDFAIGLYMDAPKEVNKWIQQVKNAAYGLVFNDTEGVYQYVAWEPVAGDGLPEITVDNVRGTITPVLTTDDAHTRCVVRYAALVGLEGAQVATYENDRLRQLRDDAAHNTLERDLPLSDAFGAQYWAQRTVEHRGRVRRVITARVTQEFKELEPGDFVRFNYIKLQIDEVMEVLGIKQRAGGADVVLTLQDVRGMQDLPAWFTDEPPLTFPSAVGGGTFTTWADADTPEKRKYVRENWGVYHDDAGYVDSANTPDDSFEASTFS